MKRGQITFWTFTTNTTNRGLIGGCFDGVHGETFGFRIGNVEDPELAAFLRANSPINATLNCDPDADALWVVFNPVGGQADDIRRG